MKKLTLRVLAVISIVGAGAFDAFAEAKVLEFKQVQKAPAR